MGAMTFTVLVFIMSALVIGEILLNHRAQARGIAEARTVRGQLSQFPSISVIRPVRGADVGAAENYAAALDNGYPGTIETIFVFDEADDPGYPDCRARRSPITWPAAATAARRSSCRARRRTAMTGKLHAMIVGEERGAPRAHRLRRLRHAARSQRAARAPSIALMTTPHAGCAFAPVVVYQPAEKAGDVGYATMLNMWYGASVATASRRTGDLPFIMGQLMVFRREALRDIGGVACAKGELVDDMAIGRAVAEKGWRNIMAPTRCTWRRAA